MYSSKMTMLAPMWVLIIIWLILVAVSAVLAFRKWHKVKDFLKKQLFYLWLGATIVFYW